MSGIIYRLSTEVVFEFPTSLDVTKLIHCVDRKDANGQRNFLLITHTNEDNFKEVSKIVVKLVENNNHGVNGIQYVERMTIPQGNERLYYIVLEMTDGLTLEVVS